MASLTEFQKQLEHLINSTSQENGSDTPDWILAEYLRNCLWSYNKAVTAREKWYGRPIESKVPLPTIAEIQDIIDKKGTDNVSINPDGSLTV